ncbi:ArsB Na+/H+ antiporter NhaD and related arsenite permeases [Rhabdaerophilaceae bacterium]
MRLLLTGLAMLVVSPAIAAEGLDGKGLAFFWALPFVGLLLCIATGPVLYHRLWEHHFGKIAAMWAGLTVLPLILAKGFMPAIEAVLHTMLLEYMSFIILLFALFTVAGGILVMGNLRGTPAVNTGILAIGTVLASIVGTTGASMILIRPIIRANDDRRHNVHVVIFFIFLVSNIGGSLTPLGDPPLFLGFLRGVDFFWTTKHMFGEFLVLSIALLVIFYILDTILHAKDDRLPPPTDNTPDRAIKLYGTSNFVLLGAIIVMILISASWKPGVTFHFPGGTLELQNIVRDVALIVIALISLKLTPKQVRAGNEFSWGPILEVAKLFAGIFICMIPVLAMLKAGKDGAFAPLVALVSNPDGSPNNIAYFWLTGILSSFLDNAPTYLVFFELAGGDPKVLMVQGALTLAAISCGAVFMGANSYIGNAPNFMVYAIAKDMGVKMPSFFAYMLWSVGILIPLFVVVTFLFFR